MNNQTCNLLKRPEAENDLINIWVYIAEDNPINADRFLDKLEERCLLLAEFPETGAHRDELIRNLRSFPLGNYIVFYFVIDGGIDIVRVLHSAMDINADFFYCF